MDRFGVAWMLVACMMTLTVVTMSVSAYCDGTRAVDDPLYGVMASGERIFDGSVACGSSFPFGTLLAVPGWGTGVCMDRGGSITDGHLDLWFATERDALKWGRQSLRVQIVEEAK